jgi:D-alanine-D-alanine ligase
LLGLTEIVPESDFFDYRAKYEGAAQEITPARIAKQASDDIIAMTRSLYNDMQLKGLCRFDYILPASGKATLIEINSVPGMSPESIVPKQINASDMAMHEFLTLLIQQALTDG